MRTKTIFSPRKNSNGIFSLKISSFTANLTPTQKYSANYLCKNEIFIALKKIEAESPAGEKFRNWDSKKQCLVARDATFLLLSTETVSKLI